MDSKLNILPACICRFALVLVFIFLFFSLSDAETVTLGWDSNDEPDLEGYIVYRNVDSPGPPYRYSDELPEEDLPNPLNPMVTITGLQENTKYYVALTAYDTEGNESNFSDNICFQIIDSAISVCSAAASSGGSSSGGGGAACFISIAGVKKVDPIFLPVFMSRLFKTFFAVLFLFFAPTAKSALPKISSYIRINKEI